MSARDDMLYFGHMLDMSSKIAQRTAALTRDRFDGDEDLRLALLHLVQTIGEAARRISPEGRAAHPEIPWREIMGMRHRIVHDYMAVDYGILWEVVTRSLPPLIAALEQTVPPEAIC